MRFIGRTNDTGKILGGFRAENSQIIPEQKMRAYRTAHNIPEPSTTGSGTGGGGPHEMPPGIAEHQINLAGLQTVSRTDRFIERKEDQDLWWLITFRKPWNEWCAVPSQRNAGSVWA